MKTILCGLVFVLCNGYCNAAVTTKLVDDSVAYIVEAKPLSISNDLSRDYYTDWFTPQEEEWEEYEQEPEDWLPQEIVDPAQELDRVFV